MPIELRLKGTLDTRALTGFRRDMRQQVPFATALALTLTAEQCRVSVRENLRTVFILRNTWTERGIQADKALKSDWPHCFAVVGSINPYMGIQEEGGGKTPGAHAFAIPKGIRDDIRQLVKRSQWPGRLLQEHVSIPSGGRPRGSKTGRQKKPVPFLMKESNGVGVYVRTSKKSRRLKRLFRLTNGVVHVHPRHWLMRPCERVVNARLEENMLVALQRAIATRR